MHAGKDTRTTLLWTCINLHHNSIPNAQDCINILSMSKVHYETRYWDHITKQPLVNNKYFDQVQTHWREELRRMPCSCLASCWRSNGLFSFCLKCCLLVHSSFSSSTTIALFVTPSRENNFTSSSMLNTSSCPLPGLHPRRAIKFTTASGRKPLSYIENGPTLLCSWSSVSATLASPQCKFRTSWLENLILLCSFLYSLQSESLFCGS